MGERPWYYLTPDHTQMGPVPESELKLLLAAGRLGPDTLVWSEPMGEWVTAGKSDVLRRQAAGPAIALTPSELVVLQGDLFATKAGLIGNGNFSLLGGEGQVAYDALSQAVFCTAMLAAERAGALKIAVRAKKALFGLRSVTTLVAEPTGSYVAWPETSMEAALTALLLGGPKEVDELLYLHLGEDSSNPWCDVVQKAVTGLEQRGLIIREEEKAFLGKKVTLRATPEALSFARSQDVSWIRQMLGGPTPERWQLLVKSFKRAISRRTEAHDSDGPDLDFD